MLDHLPDLVNANEPLVRRGRFFSCTFLVGIGATDWLIKISNGRVASATSGPHLMQSWQFSIRAPKDAWVAFWEPEPRPGFHDIFAMTKSGTAVIEGDLHPLMANLRYVKEVLESLRNQAADA